MDYENLRKRMVEEQLIPSWVTDESTACVVGFLGDSAINEATESGTFTFGIRAQ